MWSKNVHNVSFVSSFAFSVWKDHDQLLLFKCFMLLLQMKSMQRM